MNNYTDSCCRVKNKFHKLLYVKLLDINIKYRKDRRDELTYEKTAGNNR
jgi:hypothetical protein